MAAAQDLGGVDVVRHLEARSPRPVVRRLRRLLEPGGRMDVTAFAMLYDLTAARVYGVALSVLGDRDVAEQVAQEVYLELWGDADALHLPPAAVTAHAVSLAHRAAVARMRGTRDHGAGPEVDDVPGEPVRPLPRARLVREALAALPDMQRRSVELAWFGGHTCPEVGRLLEAPVESVRGWMREGAAQLRSATVSELAGPGDTMGP